MASLRSSVSLRPYHTFGLDVSTQWLFELRDETQALEFLADNRHNPMPRLILGGGSNVLFRGDFPGLVLLNRIEGIELMEETADSVLIRVGAGENWHQLVLHCLEQGWYGIENLSLIPGTVGAAPIQNIGAYGVELESVFDHLEAMHLDTLHIRRFSHGTCQFGYRDSLFKRTGKGKYLITRVALRLSKVPRPNLSYGALQQVLGDDPQAVTPQQVSEAVIAIRQSKLPDPRDIGNAGSFFKNPEISTKQLAQIQADYPDVPFYPISDSTVKVPAGWLIQTCGWKGWRQDDYGVHARQALVLVNYGQASGEELYQLSERILASVAAKFGIDLEREVQIIGGPITGR